MLIVSSLAALAGALILVVSPAATTLGFVPISSGLTITIAVIVLAYLACANLPNVSPIVRFERERIQSVRVASAVARKAG